MAKTLCERKKALKKHPEAVARMVDAPRFLCEKCGRVANKKKYVCAPRRMSGKPTRAAARQVA